MDCMITAKKLFRVAFKLFMRQTCNNIDRYAIKYLYRVHIRFDYNPKRNKMEVNLSQKKIKLIFSMCADYVYFETSSSSPYQIRRIEELNKTPSGNVEAKVMCFYRRRDLPTPLVQLADKHQSEYQFSLIILTT